MKTRTLKIEAAGDFHCGPVIPKIRLAGQWLERAGFKPGNRVEIKLSAPGTLTLRFVDQALSCGDENKQSNQLLRKLKSGTEVEQSDLLRPKLSLIF